MSTMWAVWIPEAGGAEVLEIRQVPRPSPAANEILVRVRASGVNRADLLQRRGRYPAPPGTPQEVPGLEFAGEVAECGANARRWREGDRVFGIVAGGAHAEFVVTHEDAVAAVPKNLIWQQAGGIPEIYITAHDALYAQAAVQSGESVLVSAAGSGVGLTAVQLARAAGAVPYGISRRQDKIERALEHGLEAGWAGDAPYDGLQERIAEWTQKRGINITLDLIGGTFIAQAIRAAAMKGRIMLIGAVAGGKAELELGTVLGKRLVIRGTVLRARPLQEKIEATRAFERDAVPLFADGRLQPVIDSVFPFREIVAAHRRLESNDTFGKVVLESS